jgi:hypothetical protein
MSSKITTSALMGFIALPVLGLFLLLRQQGPIGIWKIALLGTGIAYLVVVAQSFPNLYFGIAVAHISFVSTFLWYALGASEFGNSKQTDAMSGSSVISILSALIIPVCDFQIVASGSRLFGNVGMEPCTDLMRSWLAVTILLSMVLLFGRQYYWRELNWFEDSLHKRATEETILFYLVTGFMAAMIYPFFLSDFPNPIRILFCMFQ